MNPLFFETVTPPSNHAPVVANMRPAPSFKRLELNVGVNCAPLLTFQPDFIKDAELETLTVRWSLLMEAVGFESGIRARLREEDLEPFGDQLDGAFYSFAPFQVSREVITAALVPLAAQTDVENGIDGQLLELIVSDRGFQPGADNVPDDGAGTFYMSWPVRLIDVPCTKTK